MLLEESDETGSPAIGAGPADEAKSPRSAGLSRAALVTYASYAVTILAAVALPLVIARTLGVGALGLFSLLSLPYIGGQTLDSGLALGSLAAAARQSDEARAAGKSFASAQSACASLAAGYLAVTAVACLIVPFALPTHLAVSGTAVLAASAGAGAILVATSPARTLAVATQRFSLLATSNCISAVTTLACGCIGVPLLHWWGLSLAVFLNVAVGRLYLVWAVRKNPIFQVRASRPTMQGLRDMRHELLPAITVAGTGQLVMVVDLITLSLLYDKGVVGAYRLGVLIPNQVVAVLFLGADLWMPRLARARYDRELVQLTARLNLVLSFASGLLLSVAAIQAPFLLHLLAGTKVAYATGFARIFCFSQALNSMIHMWAIFVFARGQQSRIAGLVRLEAWGNALATVALVALIGPFGCGLATVVAIGVSNLYFLPRLLRSQVKVTGAVRSVVESACASVVGLACAGLAAGFSVLLGLSGWAALTTESAAALVIASAGVAAMGLWRPGQVRLYFGRPPEVGASC